MTDTNTIPPEALLDVQALLPDGTHLIAGEWVRGHSGEVIEVLNPATQDLLATVPRGTAEDIDASVRAAEEAFASWRETSPTVRGELLYRWAELCGDHAEEIDLLECLEVGHPSLLPSLIPGIIRYVAGVADKLHGQSLPTTNLDVMGLTLREPFGVCGILIPWNGPSWSFSKRAVAPLVAGNTLVVKPGEDAPLTLLYMVKLAHEAGIPPGVINVVTGYGQEAGEALTHHRGIKRLSFTGSPETGARVMAAASTNVVPVHLELGGKSPQVVLRDAPLEKAIPLIAAGIVANSGQSCAAGSRVVVDESIRSEVVEALKAALEKVTVGLWYENVDMGPLVSAKQEQRVLDYIEIGKKEGARLVTGGNKITGGRYDRGFFVEPTLFDDVRPDMRIAQEEIFGPVLSVIGFEDESEALAIANGTRYGLVSAVWTRDVNRAVKLARRIDAGLVSINTLMGMGAIGVPAGGYKHSGFGRISSAESVLEWTQTKAVVFG